MTLDDMDSILNEDSQSTPFRYFKPKMGNGVCCHSRRGLQLRVSRSIARVSMLIVDATQGIEAQTISIVLSA